MTTKFAAGPVVLDSAAHLALEMARLAYIELMTNRRMGFWLYGEVEIRRVADASTHSSRGYELLTYEIAMISKQSILDCRYVATVRIETHPGPIRRLLPESVVTKGLEIRSVEDGIWHTDDHDEEPEMFWAIQDEHGGGNVTLRRALAS